VTPAAGVVIDHHHQVLVTAAMGDLIDPLQNESLGEDHNPPLSTTMLGPQPVHWDGLAEGMVDESGPPDRVVVGQLGLDAGSAVGLVRLPEDATDQRRKLDVGTRARRGARPHQL